MKNLNGEETLWVILPIIIVVGILIASIIILPKTQTEIRSKASEPVDTPSQIIYTSPTQTQAPEIVCSSLYSPVCSPNQVTYLNECEANQAGVTSFTQGACVTPTSPKTTPPTPAPQILPSSN